MKLYSVHEIWSQKPLRPTCWSLFLGILQTGMGLHWENVFFFKSINVIYCSTAYWKLNQKNNKRVGSENELVTSYCRSKILKILGKITISIPVCSWKCSCSKQSNRMHWNLLIFYIKCIWNKTDFRNSWNSKALSKNLKWDIFQSAKTRSKLWIENLGRAFPFILSKIFKIQKKIILHYLV